MLFKRIYKLYWGGLRQQKRNTGVLRYAQNDKSFGYSILVKKLL